MVEYFCSSETTGFEAGQHSLHVCRLAFVDPQAVFHNKKHRNSSFRRPRRWSPGQMTSGATQPRDETGSPSEAADGRVLRLAEPPTELEVDVELLTEFVSDSTERLTQAEEHLKTLEQEPRDQEALNAVFRCFHTIKGLTGFLNLEEIEDVAHASEDLLDRARSDRTLLCDDALELVRDAVDQLTALVGEVRDALPAGPLPTARHDSVPALIERIRRLVRAVDLRSPPSVRPSPPTIAASIRAPAVGAPSTRATRRTTSWTPRDRVSVDASDLERLVAIADALSDRGRQMRGAVAGGASPDQIASHLDRMDDIAADLGDLAASLSVVSIGDPFAKVAKFARDMAAKAGKAIDVEISGGDTQIDKRLGDPLNDSLVHLVRNAVDHGVEPSEEREAAGKPAFGRIRLTAGFEGSQIHIGIEDDGRGIDHESILTKAKERGLVSEDGDLDRSEVLALICEPGFTTADQVTYFSGRGVGMDVVKRHVDAVGGTLRITSEPGRGTRFFISFPSSLGATCAPGTESTRSSTCDV